MFPTTRLGPDDNDGRGIRADSIRPIIEDRKKDIR